MIEVEYIPVGEKTDTGDAILCHFTEPGTSTNRVVLIDGGFAATAAAIVAHVQKYYGTDRIDLMICTHPDEDHINGLFGVLEQLHVTQLVIHRPSDYGYASDDVASDKVDDLIRLAKAEGTAVSTNYFAGNLVLLRRDQDRRPLRVLLRVAAQRAKDGDVGRQQGKRAVPLGVRNHQERSLAA